MFLIKCYWILQKSGVTASIFSKLLRENQQGSKDKITPSPPRLGLNAFQALLYLLLIKTYHFFHFLSLKQNILSIRTLLIIGIFIPREINDPLTSSFIINLIFYYHILHILTKAFFFFFCYYISWVFTFCFFLQFKQYNNIVMEID